MAFSFGAEMLKMTMLKKMDKNRVVELNEPVITNEKVKFSDVAK
jgi:hypothetical protein